jgi:ACS family pantothenate transporter-like MFS transporter
MWAMIAVSIAMAAWTAFLVFMHVRTERRRSIEGRGTPAVVKGMGLQEHGNQVTDEKV